MRNCIRPENVHLFLPWCPFLPLYRARRVPLFFSSNQILPIRTQLVSMLCVLARVDTLQSLASVCQESCVGNSEGCHRLSGSFYFDQFTVSIPGKGWDRDGICGRAFSKHVSLLFLVPRSFAILFLFLTWHKGFCLPEKIFKN